jgi:hypothetical protein
LSLRSRGSVPLLSLLQAITLYSAAQTGWRRLNSYIEKKCIPFVPEFSCGVLLCTGWAQIFDFHNNSLILYQCGNTSLYKWSLWPVSVGTGCDFPARSVVTSLHFPAVSAITCRDFPAISVVTCRHLSDKTFLA